MRRLTSDNLFLGRFAFVPLEHKVAESARESEIAIHPIELDPSARRHDSLRFGFVRRLVVEAERLGHPRHARNRSRVAYVALQRNNRPSLSLSLSTTKRDDANTHAIDAIVLDQNDYCCGTR